MHLSSSQGLAVFINIAGQLVFFDVTQQHHQQITWQAYEAESGEEMTVMVRWFDQTGYDVDITALRGQYPQLLTYREFLLTLDWQ